MIFQQLNPFIGCGSAIALMISAKFIQKIIFSNNCQIGVCWAQIDAWREKQKGLFLNCLNTRVLLESIVILICTPNTWFSA